MNTRASLTALVLIAACSPREVTELTPELEAVVEANNRFSLELQQAVQQAEPQDNLFLSPFSVSAALSMTLAGANGETETQMRDVLHVEDEAQHHENLGLLVQDLGGLHPGRAYQLHTANRLFGQEGATWKEDFLGITEQDYAAPLEELDFASDPEGSRTHINEWGAEQTQGLIEDVLPPGSIHTETRLALANAIYFKADWLDAFDEDYTADRDFTLEDGTVVQVPTMSGEMELMFGGSEEVAVIGLPYEDEELAFWVVMPTDGTTLAELEASLDATELSDWMDGADQRSEITVQLPRFELRNQLALGSVLTEMGMVDAFTSGADFSGMSEALTLALDDVHHQAYVKVDEEGTTAAAVTVVTSYDVSYQEPTTIDRPFLFLIRDELTGTVLFTGRMGDPSLAQDPA